MPTYSIRVLPAQNEPQSPLNSQSHLCETLSFILRVLIGIWICIWVSGCAAPPDPTRFADSTRSLATSGLALGRETAKQLESSPETHRLASDFERQWSARDRALAAAGEYSQSLAVIFARPHAEQPAALSASLQSLARAVGVGGSIEGGGMLASTADMIAFVHAQLTLVQISNTLDKALTQAQPIVDRIATLIVADTADLEKIIRAAAAVSRLSLTTDFDGSLAFAESVERRRNEIRRLSYTEMGPAALEELARLDAFKASVTSDLVPYFSRLATIDQRESDSLEAVRAVRVAIESWATAHRSLAEAVRENQPPDTEALAEAAVQLKGLLARMSHR